MENETYRTLVNFNPRSREGSDVVGRCYERLFLISIHAPAKGATTEKCVRTKKRNTFQSTLPRRERQAEFQINPIKVSISIHAPAKGATGPGDEYIELVKISIHAPAKGATKRQKQARTKSDISIHAPAKGATGAKGEKRQKKKFQSTLPRRERQKGRRSWQKMRNFNPRSREGSDLLCTHRLLAI